MLQGNCTGPPSPGEKLKVRVAVAYRLRKQRHVTWGLRATTSDGSLAGWLKPSSTRHRKLTKDTSGRAISVETLKVVDNGPLDERLRLRTFGRIESRASVTSNARLLRVGTTLGVRAVNEEGKEVRDGISVTNANCWRTRGQTWASNGVHRAVFFHVDPAYPATVMATADGYEPASLVLQPEELHAGETRYVTITLHRPAPPRPQWSSALMRTVLRTGDTTQPVIYLTFDDGFGSARQIADILHAHGVRATFCPNGSVIALDPGLPAYLAARGNVLCNHTYDHASVTGLTDAQIVSDLARDEAIVAAHSGETTKPFFRPPYGNWDSRTVEVAAEQGYRTITWDVDPGDWRCDTDAAGLAARVLSAAHWGAIVGMHTEGCKTPEALPAIIEGLQARGYRLATFAELPSWK